MVIPFAAGGALGVVAHCRPAFQILGKPSSSRASTWRHDRRPARGGTDSYQFVFGGTARTPSIRRSIKPALQCGD
jgi:hypothetical protein